MQLKGCLLIGFVLNVACLNNLSGKFLNLKYDSLKTDQISLRKSESLVESLKKDPSSFVELFAKADPERISQIIGILEGLVTDAASSLETLRSHQTEAMNNLNTANSNLVIADTNKETARVALEQATAVAEQCGTDHAVCVREQESAQLEKQVADQNYAEQSPGLLNEQSVLGEVVLTLGPLNGDERRAACIEKCKEKAYCCNNPAISSNGMFSCAQACDMRSRGVSMDGCKVRCEFNGCHTTVASHTYTFCHSCNDVGPQCPHGVTTTSECTDGCDIY